MSDAKEQGRFVWYDLMTTEPEKAIGFYTKVAGWSTTAWEGPTPYTMWTSNSTPLGGVMPLDSGAGFPPHWIGYISTPDVDATAKQATTLGARVIVPPTDVPGVGRFSILHDPQGATFAIYTSKSQAPGEAGPPRSGEFSWHELMTREQPAALRFYQMLFGWDRTNAVDMGPIGTYQMFGAGGVDLGGMFNKTDEMPGPMWVYYIRVPDLQRALDAVKANGGQILTGPMEVPGGDWIAQCTDPQGAMFALHTKARG